MIRKKLFSRKELIDAFPKGYPF